jgi:hypothetical protein
VAIHYFKGAQKGRASGGGPDADQSYEQDLSPG